MRTLLLCTLCLTACSTSPAPQPQTDATFVDSDGDGLPDTRGFGYTATGGTTFEDTDGDGLPDRRIDPSEELERALAALEREVPALEREIAALQQQIAVRVDRIDDLEREARLSMQTGFSGPGAAPTLAGKVTAMTGKLCLLEVIDNPKHEDLAQKAHLRMWRVAIYDERGYKAEARVLHCDAEQRVLACELTMVRPGMTVCVSDRWSSR